MTERHEDLRLSRRHILAGGAGMLAAIGWPVPATPLEQGGLANPAGSEATNKGRNSMKTITTKDGT